MKKPREISNDKRNHFSPNITNHERQTSVLRHRRGAPTAESILTSVPPIIDKRQPPSHFTNFCGCVSSSDFEVLTQPLVYIASEMDIGGRTVSRGMLPLLALHTVSEYYRLERKPPVTAGLLAANTLIYLRPAFLDRVLPSINKVWFNAHLILTYRDLKRFFLSPFYHMGESHLVYNMLSLLWKGIKLETSMGSTEFASMVATLLTMSQGITLLLSKSLIFFDYGKAYYNEYAVGFSGVLFAMKVVLNAQSDDYTFVHGILVPSRHAAWAELILIQLFVPGVSFLGHLGGILAGMLYLHLKRSYSGPNPLRSIITSLSGLFSWPLRFLRGMLQPRRYSGRGAVGRGERRGNATGIWRCPACTFDNSGLLSVCEMCGTGIDGNDLSTNMQSDLSLDELRRRRIERFSR